VAILITTAAARRTSPTESCTPSHTRRRMAFKYNPPHGEPADIDVTDWIQSRANDLLRAGTPRQAGAVRDRDHGARRTTTTSSAVRPGLKNVWTWTHPGAASSWAWTTRRRGNAVLEPINSLYNTSITSPIR